MRYIQVIRWLTVRYDFYPTSGRYDITNERRDDIYGINPQYIHYIELFSGTLLYFNFFLLVFINVLNIGWSYSWRPRKKRIPQFEKTTFGSLD